MFQKKTGGNLCDFVIDINLSINTDRTKTSELLKNKIGQN